MCLKRKKLLFVNVRYFISFFGIEVFIAIFCYGRILSVIRRQASVMAGHRGPGPSTTQNTQTQSHHVQSNVIKTMIFVSAFYVITWMPINVYYMIRAVSADFTFNINVHHVLLFIVFLYICTNPFIYAIKFDPVKRILVGSCNCG